MINLDIEEEEKLVMFGMLRIISEQTLNVDEETCACFIGWQKAFDHVSWSKLMQILE
jgi:hypothetical protein